MHMQSAAASLLAFQSIGSTVCINVGSMGGNL